MRLHLLIPFLTLAGTLLAKQPGPSAESGMSRREVALDNLLSERRSQADLDKVVADARKAGISEQSVIEARFLYHVDRREDAAIAAMLPDFLAQDQRFRIEDSAIFSVREDWLAVIEYVRAIGALELADKDGFKTHITEAFWLSPRQASAFAPHIERLRLEESMRSVKIDFSTRLAPLAGGDALALEKLMEGNKAMILHFWSPASDESGSTMPDYAITANKLGEAGIAMVSILPADAPELVASAREMIRPLGDKPPGAWLIDHPTGTLARELLVRTFPTFILVSNEGNILFNGYPDDDGLWQALRGIDPAIVRPGMAE